MQTSNSILTYDALYTAEQVRSLDRLAIEQESIPAITLMERAGQAAFDCLVERWPQARRIVVVCGIGNNGGDGYVVARLAKECAYHVTVLQLGNTASLSAETTLALVGLREAGITPVAFDANTLEQADVLVDAIFGIGLQREVSGEWRAAIEVMNNANAARISLDIPSGLHADTGQPLGVAVRADITTTFIGRKRGCFTGQARDYCGEIRFFDLGVPYSAYAQVPAAARQIFRPSITSLLGRRRRSAHKGDFGHALIVGGDHGMSGAARLAAEAALRCGAGWVSVATRPEYAMALNIGRPEIMVRGVADAASLNPRLEKADVIGIGPGLGTGDWSLGLWQATLATDKPLVVDADGLNLLARHPCRRDNWILTPHPGEASRLLQTSVAQLEADRFAAASEIQKRYGGVCVLKGAGTVITDGRAPSYVCAAGNPGMASGGMGDVLTGIITGLWAQTSGRNVEILEVAAQGVALHAQAADRAAVDGERGLLAGDLLPFLRAGANGL